MFISIALGKGENPDWLISSLYDYYAKLDRVPLPWTPVEAKNKEVKVWGRTIKWGNSLLPDSITTQGRRILANPIQIVVKLSGKEHSIALRRFKIAKARKSRADIIAEGEIKGIKAYANMWIEFDGFLWVNLRFQDEERERKVEGLKVVVPLKKEYIKLYQTFSRPLAGFVEQKPIPLPWLANPKENIVNFYHWFGDEEGGIGFTYCSLQHWEPISEDNFCTFIPGREFHIYQINLVEKPVNLNGRIFKFGIQATPIKPLPPDYFALKAGTLVYEPWRALNRISEDIDMCLVWPKPNGEAMEGLNNPYNVRRDILEQAREYCHRKDIAFLGVAHCPQKISSHIGKEFEEFAEDWKTLPESILEWEGVPHYQNCVRSYTLRKWLFYGWLVKNVKELGLDGIYCDGWMGGTMACSNPRHGCGWTDEKGNRHLTVPVLEGREFNKVVALFLEDNVKSPLPKTAPSRKGFPQYHFWIHSWEFVPPLMGFATEWLTGEFAGWPLQGPSMLTPEGTYGKCLGLGLFRARCLSTNWGVPNLFDALMWEASENHPVYRQTIMAYAWFLPHGVPIGMLEYMNQNKVVELSQLFERLQIRRSKFTPGWRPNPYWKIENPKAKEIMVAVWELEDGKSLLAVVSNLKVDEKVDISLKWMGNKNAKITNALSGEEIEATNGLYNFQIEPENFLLLLAKW